MKNILFCFFLAFTLSFTAVDSHAQKNKKTSFFDDVWYGGNVGLGFAGNNLYSVFNIGLSPMAGYKITPRFSVGPRLIFDYTHYRLQTTTGVEKHNLYSIGAGILTRYKVFNQFFIHGEANFVRDQYIVENAINDYEKINNTQPHVLLGAGYDSGFGEIVLLYDFLNPANTIQSPFDFRFGFNINF